MRWYVGQVARDVRGARDRDQLDAALPELALEVLVVERPVVADAEVEDLAAGAVREVVRVVLHQRDERDPVLPGHDVGGQIERLGRVPEQDQGRAVGLRPDEAQDVVGDVLEAVGRQLREVVLAPVHVRVRVLEEVLVGVEHGPRRVRARAVVQVDELLRLRRAQHLEALLGDRKLAADPLDVEHRPPGQHTRAHASCAAPPSRPNWPALLPHSALASTLSGDAIPAEDEGGDREQGESWTSADRRHRILGSPAADAGHGTGGSHELASVPCVGFRRRNRSGAQAGAASPPAAPTPAATSPSLDRALVPARGRQTATLQIPAFGRYAIRVESKQGTAVQLVDRMAGPGTVAGRPGESDGRLDLFLDRGEYRLITDGSPQRLRRREARRPGLRRTARSPRAAARRAEAGRRGARRLRAGLLLAGRGRLAHGLARSCRQEPGGPAPVARRDLAGRRRAGARGRPARRRTAARRLPARGRPRARAVSADRLRRRAAAVGRGRRPAAFPSSLWDPEPRGRRPPANDGQRLRARLLPGAAPHQLLPPRAARGAPGDARGGRARPREPVCRGRAPGRDRQDLAAACRRAAIPVRGDRARVPRRLRLRRGGPALRAAALRAARRVRFRRLGLLLGGHRARRGRHRLDRRHRHPGALASARRDGPLGALRRADDPARPRHRLGAARQPAGRRHALRPHPGGRQLRDRGRGHPRRRAGRAVPALAACRLQRAGVAGEPFALGPRGRLLRRHPAADPEGHRPDRDAAARAGRSRARHGGPGPRAAVAAAAAERAVPAAGARRRPPLSPVPQPATGSPRGGRRAVPAARPRRPVADRAVARRQRVRSFLEQGAGHVARRGGGWPAARAGARRRLLGQAARPSRRAYTGCRSGCPARTQSSTRFASSRYASPGRRRCRCFRTRGLPRCPGSRP